MNPTSQKIYDEAKKCLEPVPLHVTLNPQVPNDVGCAEAVSYILKNAGIEGIPAEGFPGTIGLWAFLSANPLFICTNFPEAGAILVSVTDTGNGKVEGHTGIVGMFGLQFPEDYGIISNNSDTGLVLETWSWSAWQKNYSELGQLQTGLFVAKH